MPEALIGWLGKRHALEHHLQFNHFPPVPLSMVPACEAAIDACVEEDFARSIELPDGVTWRGETAAPAYAIVEGHHLNEFVESAFDDEEEPE